MQTDGPHYGTQFTTLIKEYSMIRPKARTIMHGANLPDGSSPSYPVLELWGSLPEPDLPTPLGRLLHARPRPGRNGRFCPKRNCKGPFTFASYSLFCYTPASTG